VSTRQRSINGLTLDETTPNVTYAGEELTYIVGNTNRDGYTYIFMLEEPPSGTHSLIINNFNGNLQNGNGAIVGAITFHNVDPANPIGETNSSDASSNSPSLALTTTANQLVFQVLGIDDAVTTPITLNSSQTRQWEILNSRPLGGGYTKAADAGTTTLSYSLSNSRNWTLSGVAINSIVQADLAIEKTVNFPGPYAGQTIEFTLTATNEGCDDAPLVQVEDLLPSGFTYVSHTASGSTEYNAGAGIWDIGTLNNGGSATLTISAVVNASGDYTNTATISGNAVDNEPANNTSSVTIVLCQAGGTPPLFNNN
jgi:uncharacterized repeat protein (TIGR01451 family)